MSAWDQIPQNASFNDQESFHNFAMTRQDLSFQLDPMVIGWMHANADTIKSTLENELRIGNHAVRRNIMSYYKHVLYGALGQLIGPQVHFFTEDYADVDLFQDYSQDKFLNSPALRVKPWSADFGKAIANCIEFTKPYAKAVVDGTSSRTKSIYSFYSKNITLSYREIPTKFDAFVHSGFITPVIFYLKAYDVIPEVYEDQFDALPKGSNALKVATGATFTEFTHLDAVYTGTLLTQLTGVPNYPNGRFDSQFFRIVNDILIIPPEKRTQLMYMVGMLLSQQGGNYSRFFEKPGYQLMPHEVGTYLDWARDPKKMIKDYRPAVTVESCPAGSHHPGGNSIKLMREFLLKNVATPVYEKYLPR